MKNPTWYRTMAFACATMLLPISFCAQGQEKIEIPLDHFYAKRKKRVFRSILSRFVWSFSTGYGNTFLSHRLERGELYQGAQASPSLSLDRNTTRYSNWVNRLTTDQQPTQPGAFLLNTDTAAISFRGNATTIPLTLMVHYAFSRYRIGVGYTYEYLQIGPLRPDRYADKINALQPNPSGATLSRYFAVIGVSFYRWGRVLFTAEAQVGGVMLAENFSDEFTAGVYVNGGIRAEYEFSEYTNVFVRPSFEFKSYSLALPEQGTEILHNANAFYITVGLSYRLPELPRCYHRYCHVQIDHAHGNKEYRNRVHSIFQTQNPGYGENYRGIKDTWKEHEAIPKKYKWRRNQR